MLSSFNSRWTSPLDTEVDGVDSVRLNGGFIRLNLGGGGFWLEEAD